MTGKSEIWPIHFQPKSDELLSSWLARLAVVYTRSYLAFTQAIAAFASSSNTVGNFRRDWDCFASPDVLHFLADVTTTPIQVIESAMLLGYSTETLALTPYWLLSDSAIQYCPLCLSQDQVPYFRREWRFAFITCCEIHESFLADACPACSVAISCVPSRCNQEDRTVYFALKYCHNCKADLSNNRISMLPSISDLEFHRRLRRVITQGWLDLPDGHQVDAKRFFAGIQIVTHRLTIGRSAQTLQQAFSTSVEADSLRQADLPIISRHVNRLNLNHRRVILNLLWGLIQNWPTTSAKCANSAQTYNKALFKEEQHLNLELRRAFFGNESDLLQQSS